MKHIKQHLETISESTTIATAGISRNDSLPEAAKDYINRIFERMIVICPAWKASVDGDSTEWADRYKSELSAVLKESGVRSGELIKSGLSNMRKAGSPFLPSPGQFAKYCMGTTDSGLTHRTAAYTNKFWNRKQLCHKRSAEDKARSLKNIRELRTKLENK